MFKNNVFVRTYKEKKKWEHSETIACQTAPVYMQPRKLSYFRLLLENIKINKKQWIKKLKKAL